MQRRPPQHRRGRRARIGQIESFEARVLLAADPIKINFQTDSTINAAAYPELDGYVADAGDAYGSRGNGMRFGWLDSNLNPDTQNESRNRNDAAALDERYDTLNHMIKADIHSWQIDLPNGIYDVHLVMGDPSNTDQVNNVRVIGGTTTVTLLDPDGQDNWDEYTVERFSVTNGQLRLTPEMTANGSNQKLAFIELTPVAAPQLPVIGTGSVDQLTGFSARVAGIVLDSGNEAPDVTLFYGTSDGGTTPAAWLSSLPLGVQGGGFSSVLSGLAAGTTYYYRFQAGNSAGSTWSEAGSSFATLNVSVPAVVNQAAIDLEALTARLRGAVTDTGNDPPNVTIYWGQVDGGTDGAAWQQHADLGQQSDEFSWTISELDFDTTYFYRSFVQNAAGSTWAPSSAQLTTLHVTPADVINDLPQQVTSTSARIGGRVTDVGHHAPLIRLYYGTGDGGTNPASWDAMVEFPEEYGSFAATVVGLQPETTYFYRSLAVNAAGPTWAPSATTFVTSAAPTLLITELMASNVTGLSTRVRDMLGGAWGEQLNPDWIEIHNATDQPASLAGYHLTDDRDDGTMWTFPAAAQVPAGGYLVVFASGEDVRDTQLDEMGRYHTNFRLSATGEYLALTRPDGAVVHAYAPEFPNQRSDIAYGVDDQLRPHFYATATPGAANLTSDVNFVEDTRFSVDRGFFSEPFTVQITTDTPGATIVYTRDGSVPTLANGTQVAAAAGDVAPVANVDVRGTTTLRAAAFKTGYDATNVDTQTYLFLDNVLQQSETYGTDGTGLPAFTRWGHSNKNGDWAVDPDIVNHAVAANRLTTDDLRSVPTLSLVLPWEDMFVAGTGIYIAGSGSPRAVSIEQILGDGRTGFQLNGSVQIQGGSSTGRWKADKLSMRLKFTEEFGPTKLEAPLFGAGTSDRLDTVVLDAVLNFGFHHPSTGQTDYAKFIQDQFVANLQNQMGGTAPHARYHHLYIDGVYWGMYYVHERPDASFAADYLGGNREDYDVLKHNSGTAVDGTTANYRAMLTLARKDLANDANYQALAAVVDIDDFIDYMLLNFYVGNTDWAHQNWYASYNRADAAGKWRYHSWDAEHVLKSSSENVTDQDNSGGPTEIHQHLLASAEYRQMFADHVEKHLFHDGVLTPQNAAAEYQKLMTEIDRAIVGETARWGDNRVNAPYTRADWLRTQNNLLTSYFPVRTNNVLSQLRADGLYPNSTVKTPTFEVGGSPLHGGYALLGDSLTMQATGGTIYFTDDDSDPRLPGGAVSPNASAYNSALTLDTPLHLRARLRTPGGQWSALAEATFFVQPAAMAGSVAISEINYNPHASLPQFGELSVDSDDFEFIELLNVGAETVELAGVQLAQSFDGKDVEGVVFRFDSSALAPGERIVVVADEAAFRSRYGTAVRIAGTFDGRLNDGGEQLTLLDYHGQVIQQFSFGDNGNWPGRADGIGSTLELADPLSDPALPSSWRSSSEIGGTPGAAGAGPLTDVVINELLTHTDWPQIDAIELHNVTNQPIDVANWYVSDNPNQLLAYRINGAQTVIAPGGYLVFDENELGFGFKGQQSDDAWLVAANSAGQPLRFADHVKFGAAQNGVSLGRWPNGQGELFPMVSLSLGADNSGPRPGGIVISEVNYHPAPPPGGATIAQEMLEFVEVWNSTGGPLDMSHWRLNKAVDFEFPAQTVLAAHQGLVVVPFDPTMQPQTAAAFRSVYGMSAQATLLGPYQGVLDNGDENLELDRPEDIFQLGLGYLLVDRVHYDDQSPWPTTADGQGHSLQRKAAVAYGDLPTSWLAAPPAPGAAEWGALQGDLNADGTVDVQDIDLLCTSIHAGTPAYDLNGDGQTNADDMDELIHAILATSYGDANLDGVFDSSDLIEVFVVGEYEDGLAANSSWAEGDWNCDGEFDSSDLVAAFQEGSYVSGQAASRSAPLDLARLAAATAMTPLLRTAAPHMASDRHSLIRRRQTLESAFDAALAKFAFERSAFDAGAASLHEPLDADDDADWRALIRGAKTHDRDSSSNIARRLETARAGDQDDDESCPADPSRRAS